MKDLTREQRKEVASKLWDVAAEATQNHFEDVKTYLAQDASGGDQRKLEHARKALAVAIAERDLTEKGTDDYAVADLMVGEKDAQLKAAIEQRRIADSYERPQLLLTIREAAAAAAPILITAAKVAALGA